MGAELFGQSHKARLEAEPMLASFEYEQLSGRVAEVTFPFYELARRLVLLLPQNPARTRALRALLDSKREALESARQG